MIETRFFILDNQTFDEVLKDASVEGVSVDYYLMEFTDVEGYDVMVEV